VTMTDFSRLNQYVVDPAEYLLTEVRRMGPELKALEARVTALEAAAHTYRRVRIAVAIEDDRAEVELKYWDPGKPEPVLDPEWQWRGNWEDL
jgi:hypothetical protein